MVKTVEAAVASDVTVVTVKMVVVEDNTVITLVTDVENCCSTASDGALIAWVSELANQNTSAIKTEEMMKALALE